MFNLLNGDEDKDCQYLANNLFNNTKIFNAITYFQSVEELNK